MAKKKKSLMDELLEEPLLNKQTNTTSSKKVSVANTPEKKITSKFEEIAPIRKTENNLLSRDEVLSPVNMGKLKKSTEIALNKPKPKDDTNLFATTANVLKTFGQGMMKAEEGLFIDAPSAILSKLILTGSQATGKVASIFDKDLGNKILTKGMQASNQLNEIAKQDWTSNALDYYGWNKKLDNGKTVTETLEEKSAITSNDLLGKAVEGLGGMAPTILLGGLLGGSTAGIQTAEELEKVKKLQQVVSYSSLGARSFGGAYEQALQSGATPDQAIAYGISSAGVEIGTEWLSGGIPGLKNTAGGGLDELFGKYVLKEGVEETSKSLSKAIVKSLYKTSMEGVEEMISQTLEPYIKQFTYQYDDNKSFSENLSEANKQVSFQEIVEAGLVGSLTAVLLGDVDISDMKTGYQNTQAINNTIANEIQNQQNMLGRELTKEESNAIKTEIKDHANNVNQYGEEIANRIIDVKNNKTSTEGLDLEQSYKAYNGEKKYTKQINNIQKFMNNRNIDARFDATMFDNNEQNAIWTTENGKDSVIFNPNASADQVIQNIATHEMTHDIINQKTEAGTSLFNDVLENIKTQENYAEDRKAIEDLYAKYYDRNAEDFSAKVDEEMVANELGKNLGTQEYINRLVNEKPNLAKRIYNWVVDKLDNIGKSEEYKEQKAYWKSVADKFEVAYNEQKTATGEDKTAYDISYRGSHQIENAKSITELNLDDIKNKVIEIDGYLTNQAQSDLKKLQKILNNPNDTVKIYRATPVNELNSGDWVTTDKSYAQNVANNNGGKVYTYEVKASDLYYPDNVRELPSLHRLSSFQYNGENVNQTRYSLSVSEANTGKDNQGRNLTEGQQEKFKNSKATDENGNLVTVYHTTTDEVAQFNEFNPVGTDYYRFGDQVVNYYTNSKDMSGSYASQDYQMADTKRINTKEELDNYISELSKNTGNMYNVEQRDDGKYIVSQDKQISKEARDFISKLSENEKQQMLNNIYEDTHEEMKGTNYERAFEWDKFDKELQNKFNKSLDKYMGTADLVAMQQEMMKYLESPVLLHEDSRLNGEVVNLYDTQDEMFRNIKSDLQESNWSKNTKIQYEGYVDITNPYIVDAEQRNWNQVISESNEFIDDLDNRLSQETKDKLTRLYNESTEKSAEARDKYEAYQMALNNISNELITPNIDNDIRKMSYIIKRTGNEELQTILSGSSPGVNAWYNLADALQTEDVIGHATKNYIIDEFRLPENVKTWLENNYNKNINTSDLSFTDVAKSINLLGRKTTLKDIYSNNREAYEQFDKYRMPNSYFIEKYTEDNSEYVDLELEDLLETRAETMGADEVLEEISQASSVAFSKPELIRLWGTSKTTNDVVKEIIASNKDGKTNYDGVIIKNVYDYGGRSATGTQANDLYVTFNSNQFKAVDNLNPTEDADIRYSMQQDVAPETPGTRTTMGELFDRNIAPIREDLSNITEQMNNLSNQIETMQESLENASKGYVETYKEQRNENIPTRNLTEADANTLQDALMQDEGYLKSLDEQANQTTDNTKLVDKLTNEVNRRLDLDRGQKETLRNIINDSIENEYSADEISQALQKEFSKMNYEMTNQEAVDARRLIRDIPINVSDAIKTDIADYGKWKSSNFGKINFSKNGGPVDAVYPELSNQMPHLFPSDITNPTDQLLRIAEVANMAKNITETIDIDADEFDDIADYIKNTQLEDEYNAQMQSDYDLSKNIQFDMYEDIAPTTIRTQESIDNYIEKRDIAPVKPDRTQQRTENRLKRSNAWRSFREKITNRNAVIDDYAKATGNKNIKFTGDMLNSVSGEVQYNINNKQTDINGKTIGKGVAEIFEPSKKDGLYQVFNDYLFNKSNIERHRVGKGSQVPEAVSQQLVKQYEQQYPEVKEWAKDVNKYFDNVLQEQVNEGLITQEQYDNYRGENGIYRSYVPFYMDNTDTSRYFDNEGKLKPVSTLKRSKGNASDVNQLLSVEDAMAKQTYAYKRAIRQNELFKEIVLASEKYSDAMDMDVRDNPTNLNDSLYTTPEGEKVVTAYINGEKVSAKITDELFNELSGENEARIKQFEEDFSMITNPLQKASSIRRNLLTTWNPTFLARNAIKDIQDAVINSKHTAGMLKNYIPGIKELSSAKTETAQQFLALYGADNLYGDYSRKGNWFTKANELIELAPRYAEFKASLEAGDTVQEAIYNAREVTTNFGRGGYITKALNRNGFTFLNANVQGLSKLVRNLSGENGVKGVTSVVVKGAMFAMLPSIINHLLYGLGDDKDEKYEAIPDYIKDNYYLIKTEGNNFVRIPKGRINAVFGSLARRMIEAGEGEENAFNDWASNAWNQIGVGDSSGIQTIFTPLRQAFGSKNGEAWYGGDIVPTRLQNKPAGEQTDAKIDAISNFIGENLGISPYKINYVLDQYTGGFGDVLLPMITPETSSGAEKPHEYLTAPIKDAFVINSTDDNKYAGEFYDLKDKLQIQSNSDKATDEDKIKYKYMSEVSRQMSELYKEKREVQADTSLGKKAKYKKVQLIQNEINSLAKEGLSNYQNADTTENYSEIGGTEYYKNAKNEWTKVNDDEVEFTAGLNTAEKDSYFKAKNKIYGITQDYSNRLKGLDKDDPKKQQLYADRKEDITQAIVNSGLDNQMKAMVYSKYYSNQDTMTNVVNAGYDVDTYITALKDIDQLRTKYSQKNGYTTAQRKAKTIAYINSLNMEIPQKAMMIRNYYTSFRQYNNDIVKFVANLDLDYEDKKAILEGTGMTVNGNRVSWK